ncbi:hypothetical protein [Pseudogulbenkiania subflava]|uniref:Uncharacterized protein n=1 Tax=Pseudogulbenkiania subflava DSM 22618 TaxID=1123014 RepID=A0A1Y6BVT5_9NEIS|nr:hypothetical protein [Pseudogulbenkiania subflava]SMF27627.1 hypothetical protein SAMN02745746_02315 [Pseudogulbenkiania subflava DSM 22618]
MKLLRLVLTFLLLLAIPFLGVPASAMPQTSPCPMQSDMTHRMDMASDHHCCQMAEAANPDSSSKAKSSSPCKFGQDCQLGQVYSPAVASIAFQTLPATPIIAVHPDTVMSSHDPSGLWRPPQI